MTSAKRVKILITNDDGVDAPGMLALAEQLHRVDKWDIRVACPSSQQSAQSHRITVHHALAVEPYTLAGDVHLLTALCVEGSPADCVKVVLSGAIWPDWKPDLVLSGINDGGNVGYDLMYSGTFGAACEATILGIPAIALSLAFHCPLGTRLEPQYLIAAERCSHLIESIAFNPKKLANMKGMTMNVNVPNIRNDLIKGFRYCRQGESNYTSTYRRLQLTEHDIQERPHRIILALEGEQYIPEKDDDSDAVGSQQGWITVGVYGLKQEIVAESKSMISEWCGEIASEQAVHQN